MVVAIQLRVGRVQRPRRAARRVPSSQGQRLRLGAGIDEVAHIAALDDLDLVVLTVSGGNNQGVLQGDRGVDAEGGRAGGGLDSQEGEGTHQQGGQQMTGLHQGGISGGRVLVGPDLAARVKGSASAKGEGSRWH